MRKPQLRFVFAASLMISGCGTISDRYEIVNVQTGEDPVTVKLDDVDPFTSPAFIHLHRGRTHHLHLTDSATKTTILDQDIICGPRWITSGLGNALMAGSSWAYGLAGIGIDLLDGAAFQCGADFPIPPLPLIRSKKASHICATYLIAPPGHPDLAVSDRLSAEWQKAKRLEPGFCGSFVKAKAATEIFNYLNISNRNAATFRTLNKVQANFLGYETKADFLVVIQDGLSRGKAALNADVIDLHTLERKSEPPVQVDPQLAQTLSRAEHSAWLMYSFSLIPNTFLYGATMTTRPLHDAVTNGPVTSTREHDFVPKIISSLGVGSLDHPLGFGEWDASLRFYPTADFNYWSVDVRTPSRPGQVKYTAIFAFLPYNAGLSLYTPVGTFGFSVGAGPVPLVTYGSGPHPDVLLGVTAEESWTVFVSRDFFVQVSHADRLANRQIKANGVQTRSWSESAVQFGYYTDRLARLVQATVAPARNLQDSTSKPDK